MPPKNDHPHMPRLNDIQEALGLQNNTNRFLRIRKTAIHLLQSAGILLHPAYKLRVQTEKRDLANKLEQGFPDVFGVTPGINRDFALQRDTSYALLTLAMDSAKRVMKRTGQPGYRAQAKRGRGLAAPSPTPEPPGKLSRRLESLFTPTPKPERAATATPGSESCPLSPTPEPPGILPQRLEALFTPTIKPERAATATSWSESRFLSLTPEPPGILPQRLEALFTPTVKPERAATATSWSESCPLSLTPGPPGILPQRLESMFTPTPIPERAATATLGPEPRPLSPTPEPPGILPQRLESMFTPTPIPERAATAIPGPEPLPLPAIPAPEAHNKLVLIFRGDCHRHNIYSAMSWTEMIGDGSDQPTLAKVHDNLIEDGLDVTRDMYTLINPEGRPVRSDRTFNYVLNEYRELGDLESHWKIRY